MKLSVVVICWNDLKVIKDCLESIYRGNLHHCLSRSSCPTMAPTDTSVGLHS